MNNKYVTFDGISGSGKSALIDALLAELKGKGLRVAVFDDNDGDPARQHCEPILKWCKGLGRDKNLILLSAFAAGKGMMKQIVQKLLDSNDVVLRHRSEITSIAYQSSSNFFTVKHLHSLYYDYMNMLVPDLAVIIDCNPQAAQNRVLASRPKEPQAAGIRGKISGDLKNRLAIQENFLMIPKLPGFQDRTLVLDNSDLVGPESVESQMARFCKIIIPKLGF